MGIPRILILFLMRSLYRPSDCMGNEFGERVCSISR